MVIYTRMKKETLQGLNKSCLVSKRHLDAINKCVEIIQCFDLVFEEIILFGSCAKSRSRFGSDIDLMILVNEMPPKKKIFDLKNILCDEIEMKSGIEVDLKVATAISRKVLKKPVKSVVLWSRRALTTPLLHHF